MRRDREKEREKRMSERKRKRVAREEGEGPWEERAICIPNDRMTFARCIKMPLIDGARENTFGRDPTTTTMTLDKAERTNELLDHQLDELSNLFKADESDG